MAYLDYNEQSNRVCEIILRIRSKLCIYLWSFLLDIITNGGLATPHILLPLTLPIPAFLGWGRAE